MHPRQASGRTARFVVPRGVEHCPLAADEAHFLIVGPDVTSDAAGGKPAWSHAPAATDDAGQRG